MKKIIVILFILILNANTYSLDFKLIKGFDIGFKSSDLFNVKYVEDNKIKTLNIDKNESLFFSLTTGVFISGFRLLGSYGMNKSNNNIYDEINIVASYSFLDFEITYNHLNINSKDIFKENLINQNRNTFKLSFYKEF